MVIIISENYNKEYAIYDLDTNDMNKKSGGDSGDFDINDIDLNDIDHNDEVDDFNEKTNVSISNNDLTDDDDIYGNNNLELVELHHNSIPKSNWNKNKNSTLTEPFKLNVQEVRDLYNNISSQLHNINN